MNDLVSIIMPSFNTGKFIAESIRSVLAQSYAHWELIIVDDCSTDNTDAVVAEFADPRIRYLKNDRNSGAAVSRNYALREAKGRWIAFLDSDDLWTPDKLEKQLRFMREGGYAFSYTNYREIDEQSQPLGNRLTGPKKISKAGMYAYCWPGCLTVMYDASVAGLIQIFPIGKNNDYAMWLQVIRKASCHLLNEDLAFYRKRSGSISNHSYTKLIKWHYKLFREADGRNPLVAAVLTAVNLACGVWKKLHYLSQLENK